MPLHRSFDRHISITNATNIFPYCHQFSNRYLHIYTIPSMVKGKGHLECNLTVAVEAEGIINVFICPITFIAKYAGMKSIIKVV